MKIEVVLAIMPTLIQICNLQVIHSDTNAHVLSRKKRYFNFPPKTSAVLQVSLSIGYLWEATNSPLPRWNSVLSWDLGFPLPNTSALVFGRKNPLHRKERSMLYHNVADMLDMHGMDGRLCVMRSLCEVRNLRPGRSLLEDILHAVFTIPQGYGDELQEDGYEMSQDESFCMSAAMQCPFSLLSDLLM